VAGLNRCDRVFAISAHTAALLDRWRIDAPVSIVMPGCDVDVFRPRPGLTEQTRRRYGLPVEDPVVLTVGRLVARKGHLQVLAALERLARPVHWAVVGGGPIGFARDEAVRRSGMSERVSIVAGVPLDELALLYAACDLFVLTP
jgi:glycosyltransferase involved in cell wall biosynthesis